MSTRKLFATLIGINNYMSNALRGCVKDVLEIDALLREICAQQQSPLEYTPLYLLAPNQADEERISKLPVPIQYEAPTFAHITQKAFSHLKQAQPGDICVLFYSGHGSQIKAPAEFSHLKSDGQNETLVCVDSRDPASQSRDLIDKELAYLIWDALEGKDVHCLVIMDCCHSGNNMRAIATEDEELRYRMEAPSAVQAPLDQYLGFNDPRNFYEPKNGKASIKIARYVQLSSAQDFEKAAETRAGGLFTSRLIPFLRAGGTARSYRSIIQNLAVTVTGRYAQQHPVISATRKEDEDLQFLGADLIPYQASYEVRYDFSKENWILHGGAMHGITPSTGGADTLVKIMGVDQTIKITQTGATTSVLDKAGMAAFDNSREDYKAVIVQMAGARLNIGLAQSLQADAGMMAALQAAYEKAAPFYLDLDFHGQREVHDYLIRLTAEKAYLFTASDSDVPLFARTEDAAQFLGDAEQIGRWCSVAEMRNVDTTIKDTDFVFTLEIIEGEDLGAANADELPGTPIPLRPDEEIRLRYRHEKAPGFRLSVALADNATLTECFIGVLYLGSKYGIAEGLIDASASRLVKGGAPITLQFINPDTGKEQHTIPVNMDELYYTYGINEITDLLKIFVSTQPLQLSSFEQEELPLETPLTRGIGFAKKSVAVDNDVNWTIFTNHIRITGVSSNLTPSTPKKIAL
ncbi:caspase family protein [Chitinophaga agrisoli]|uniref:Caspase family protein n=1 Tax=Chitinophaga agrisoli TaxID=2607653 RepID=A0A5B2VZ15_9BACT|nr:caspase family protein [Chitinophaga agrisoli]KAA2243562.1 caspase family protein [Chitinophaga agrisoli]